MKGTFDGGENNGFTLYYQKNELWKVLEGERGLLSVIINEVYLQWWSTAVWDIGSLVRIISLLSRIRRSRERTRSTVVS